MEKTWKAKRKSPIWRTPSKQIVGNILSSILLLFFMLALALTIREKNGQIEELYAAEKQAQLQVTILSEQIERLQKQNVDLTVEVVSLIAENKKMFEGPYDVTCLYKENALE